MTSVTVLHSFYRSQSPSGENVVVRSQVQALMSAGYQVSLISRESDEVTVSARSKVQSLFRVATGYGSVPRALLTSARGEILHVHNTFPNFPVRGIAKWNGPTILTLHNYRQYCASANFFRDGTICMDCTKTGLSWPAIQHKCYRSSRIASIAPALATSNFIGTDLIKSVDKLVALSDLSARVYVSLGVAEERIRTIPNFVADLATLREELTDHDGDYWVFAGRLTPDKGVLRLISEWPGSERLVVIGGGPSEEACRDAARSKNVLFTGVLSQHETRAYLASSNAMIFPSQWLEVCPTVYIEALSLGVPTIALRGNAVAEAVSLEGTGVTYSTSEELQSALQIALSGHWNEPCRNAYESKYSERAWLTSTSNLYAEMLDQ